MADRETKKITTPFGKREVEMKSYLIGREKRALTNVYAAGMSINTQSRNASQHIEASTLDMAENLALQTIIISIDGKKDGDVIDDKPFSIVQEVLDMRGADYDFVVKHINELRNDEDFEGKKK